MNINKISFGMLRVSIKNERQEKGFDRAMSLYQRVKSNPQEDEYTLKNGRIGGTEKTKLISALPYTENDMFERLSDLSIEVSKVNLKETQKPAPIVIDNMEDDIGLPGEEDMFIN